MDALPVWRRLRLRDNPFDPGFHPSRPFFGEAHDRASRALRAAIADRHPLIVLTGQAGGGRSTLLQAVSADPAFAARTLVLAATAAPDFLTVLRALLVKLEPEGAALTPNSHLGSRLSVVLHRQPEAGAVLALDDADRIDPGVVEDAIRLTSVINANIRQFTLVLVGGPVFATMVQSLLAMMLHPPAVTRVDLSPLSASDAAAYIAHYLAEAGYQGALPFSGEAALRIAEAAAGLPLDINRLCATALESLAPVRLPIDYSFVAAAIMAQRGTLVTAAEAAAEEAVAPSAHEPPPAPAKDSDEAPRARETADGGPILSESLTFTVHSPEYGVLPTQLVPLVGGFGQGLHVASLAPPAAPLHTRRSRSRRRRRVILLAGGLGAAGGAVALWAANHGVAIVDRLQAMLGTAATPAIAPMVVPDAAPAPVPAASPKPAPAAAPAPVTAPAPAPVPQQVPEPVVQAPAPSPAVVPPVVAVEPPPPAPEPAAAAISATTAPATAAESPAESPAVSPPETAEERVAVIASPTRAPPPTAEPPAATAIAPPSAPPVASPVTPPAAGPRADDSAATTASGIETAALVRRGQDLLAQADIASAQLFFRLAADHGSADAARAIAMTVDPIALSQTPIPGGREDPVAAILWYRRAIALGDSAAEGDLARLVRLLLLRADGGDTAAAAALKALP